MKSTLISIAVITAACFFAISGCEETDEPIRIGATMSETGAYSTQGVAARNGYLLCEKHVNERGGLLGRDIEFTIYDDESDSDTAIELYEQLIVEDGVDAIMGPYGSTLTEAVAPVTEEHRMVHISPLAATTSIWEQGREYLFMVLPPAELFLAGLIEIAHENDLERVAIIQEDELFPSAAGDGAVEHANDLGMEVVVHETYATGTEDFTDILQKLEDEGAEVVGMAASPLDDFIAATRQMKENDINVQMFGTSGAVDEFQEGLGEDAEYIFGLSAWEPSVPNPGVDEFVEDYVNEFDRNPSFHAAGGYGSCQLFIEAAENVGSIEDQDALRDELLELETQTVFSEYAVDERGYQTANTGLFIQWQEGERAVVWPDELATHDYWFPMPGWDER